MTKRKGSLAPTITYLLQQAFALSLLDLAHSALSVFDFACRMLLPPFKIKNRPKKSVSLLTPRHSSDQSRVTTQRPLIVSALIHCLPDLSPSTAGGITLIFLGRKVHREQSQTHIIHRTRLLMCRYGITGSKALHIFSRHLQTRMSQQTLKIELANPVSEASNRKSMTDFQLQVMPSLTINPSLPCILASIYRLSHSQEK